MFLTSLFAGPGLHQDPLICDLGNNYDDDEALFVAAVKSSNQTYMTQTSRRVDGSEQVASRNTMTCSTQQILTKAVIIQQV